MCEPRSVKGRLLGALFAVATAVVTVTIAVGVGLGGAGRRRAIEPRSAPLGERRGGAWQFPVPTGARLQQGGRARRRHAADRRDRLHRRQLHPDRRPQRHTPSPGRIWRPRASPPARYSTWTPVAERPRVRAGRLARQLAAVRRRGVHAGQRSVVSAPGGVRRRHRPDLPGAAADRRSAARSRRSPRWAPTSTSAARSATSVGSRISAWPSSAPTAAPGGRSTRAGMPRPTTRSAT